MCLAFASMTQNVVDEIKVAQQHLLSPAHFRRRFSQRSDRLDVVRQAVAQIERLKQEIASWLGTMSLWFTIHMATLLLTVIGNVILTIVSAPLHDDWWGFDFLYLTMIVSFSVPFLSASRVARHWDRMTDAVMTSEKWLPEHWQEHMYLRQFLELSPGGYYLLGFRISGSIVFFIGSCIRQFSGSIPSWIFVYQKISLLGLELRLQFSFDCDKTILFKFLHPHLSSVVALSSLPHSSLNMTKHSIERR